MSGSSSAEVEVIGAGYAGPMATNRLLASVTEGERPHLRVRVNPRAHFVERIRLHKLAAGSRESVTVPLGDVLHEDAELIVGSAKMINPDDREVTVTTADGKVLLHYDHMIYALGSVAAAPTPGARENAFLLADVDDAGRLRVDECLRSLDAPRTGACHPRPAPPSRRPRRQQAGALMRSPSDWCACGWHNSPRRFHLGGPPAAMVKETICAMIMDAPRKERTKPGSYTSPKGPRAAA